MRMNIFSLDHYRKIAQCALDETGAFLRISRGDGLFVTDAKRRNADMEAIYKKLSGFSFFEKEGLTYLTPDYGFSNETNSIYTTILKADEEQTQKLIRTHLAVAMRMKNQEQIDLFKFLYERMMNQ